MRCRFWILFLSLFCLHCGTSFSGDPISDANTGVDLGPADGPAQIDTIVSQLTIVAGTTVSVSCEVKDKDGNPIAGAPTSFTVSIDTQGNPLDPAAQANAFDLDGDKITFKKTGVFNVACRSTDKTTLLDTTPASVKVDPAAAQTVTTTIGKSEITAGDALSVTCQAFDAYGNTAPGAAALSVTPVSGFVATDNVFRPTVAGTYQIACALPDGSATDPSPKSVLVKAGPPRKLSIVLAKSTIQPAEQVGFTCNATDIYGNAVSGLKTQIAKIAGIVQDDFAVPKIHGSKAGIYSVRCTPQEDWIRNVEELSSSLTIVPGAPVALEVKRSPAKPVYKKTETVQLTFVVKDAQGNIVPDAEIELVQAHASLTVSDSFLVGFDADLVSLSMTVGIKGTAVTQVLTFNVGAKGPVIVITYPPRGAMIQQPSQSVTVTGKVTDHQDKPSEVKSFTINGLNVSLNAKGEFSFKLGEVTHGLNVISAVATDQLDRTSNRVQSFYFSTKFHPISDVSPTLLKDAILVRMNPDLIDDNVHNPAVVDDLATVVEIVLNGIDVFSYFPSPAYSGSSYDIFVKKVTYQRMSAKLWPINDGLQLEVTIPAFEAEIDADGPIDASGTIEASTIVIKAKLVIAVQNDLPKVTATEVTVNLYDFNIDVHWAINWIINFFEAEIQADIQQTFSTVLKTKLAETFEDFLQDLRVEGNYPIANLFDGTAAPTSLVLTSALSSSSFDPSGGLIGLGAVIYAAKTISRPSLGSIRRDGCLQTNTGLPSFNAFKRIGLGISLDLLNMALYGLWSTGGLQFSVPPETLLGNSGIPGITLKKVDVEMWLPPILTNCSGAMRMQVGDLKLDIAMTIGVTDVTMTLFVSFEADANLEFQNETIKIAVQSVDNSSVAIELNESEGFDIDDATLISLIKSTALPKLTDLITGKTFEAFPLPEIDFSSVSAGAKLKLKDPLMSLDRDYIVINADTK